MKPKHVLFVLPIVLLTGCDIQQKDFLATTQRQNVARDPYLITEQQAISEAVSFMDIQQKMPKKNSRIRVNRKPALKATPNVLAGQKGVYVVSFGNNEGYAVVSADRRDGVSVYFASSEGGFDANDPVIKRLLSAASDYQDSSIATYAFNPDKGDGVWIDSTIVEEKYGPLLNTCWHQGRPFNGVLVDLYADNVSYTEKNLYVGCVPVAVGQIVNYYKNPQKLNNESIDWELISLATGKEGDRNMATDAASRLLYLIGSGIGIKYPQKSASSFDGAKKAFSMLGYSYSVKSGFSEGLVKSQVASKMPVYVQGENDESGHAWVVDGWARVRNMRRVYDDEGNLVPNTVLNDYNWDEIREYVHVNYGWGDNYLVNATTYREYISDVDHRIWTYSDIFSVYSSYEKKYHDYNKNVKMIYDIKVNRRR